MKATSTIQREICRLQRMAENERYTGTSRHVAYEVYHALRWVIKDVAFTPRGEAGRYLEIAELKETYDDADFEAAEAEGEE